MGNRRNSDTAGSLCYARTCGAADATLPVVESLDKSNKETKVKRIIPLLAIIAIFCFVPVVKVSYPVVVDIPVTEEYTVTEPYTVWEDITVPYITQTERARWVDDGSWDYAKNYCAFTVEEYMDVFQSVTPGRWVVEQYPTTRYKTEVREVVRYREVTKTRTVMEPGIMYEWKKVSLLQGFNWK